VPGNGVVCGPLDECHTAGVCNPVTGMCTNPTKANGSTCSDGDACTLDDACTAGSCVSGPVVACDDGNA
jgi:hypothetical protein